MERTQNLASSERALQVRVNQLFEKNNVETVRTIHQNTKEEIEEKRKRLRALVGERYRDLIHSADSIVDMDSTARGIKDQLMSIEDTSTRLQRLMRSPLESSAENRDAEPSSTLSLAFQIKELVDTPERIWVALEQHDYLRASDMYLEAFARYERLAGEDQSNILLNSIPLLSRQWATISQFPSKIEGKSRLRLFECDVTAVDLARALYALSQLQGLSVHEALHHFMESRKEAVKRAMSGVDEQSVEEKGSSAVERTIQLARAVQNTIIHTATIFITADYLSRDEKEVLSRDLPSLQDDYQRPLFDVLLRSTVPEEKLSEAEVKEQCTQWMSQVEALLSSESSILDQITTIENLQVAEKQVWEDLRTAHDERSTWNSVSKSLLPSQFQDLWSAIFSRLFFDQSKKIITKHFSTLTITPLVQQALQSTENLDAQNSLMVSVWQWEEDETIGQIKNKASAVPSTIATIVQVLDNQLSEAMKDLSFLIKSKRVRTPLRTSSSASFNSLKQESNAELQAYIQSFCFETLSAILQECSQRADTLLQNASTEQAEQTTTKVLFLAKLCAAIVRSSKQIEQILPDSGVAMNTEQSRFSQTYSYLNFRAKTEPNPFKVKLERRSHFEYLRGYIWWTQGQAAALSDQFQQDLQKEDWTNGALRKTSWNTIEVELQKGTKESIKVPGLPSAFVSQLLFRACESIHQQSAHRVDPLVTRYMAQVLLLQLIPIYETLLATHSTAPENQRICREGLVQILFDMRFLFDVLSGAYANSEEWPEILKEAHDALESAALLNRNKELHEALRPRMNALVSTLKKQFEPIDLAFYEPRVQNFVQNSYLQNLVSLGYFISVNRLYPQSTKASFTRPNVIPLASPVARFPTLPVGSQKK